MLSVNRFCYWEGACQCVHTPSWLMTNLWRKYSPTNSWWFTFLLIYPGATMFLIYAQELKSKWACHFYCDCEPNTLKIFFTSFVRPLLEYAVPVWDPHLVKDIAALESVQRFDTKVCTKAWEDVDYDEWLCMLNLLTLKARRHSLKFYVLYKLLNGLTIHTIV